MPRQQAGRKDGGIKLLDITEQPLGYAAAKKRKRQQDLEEQQKRALETQSSPPVKVEAETPPVVTTPDYAAGLNATPVYTQPATPAPVKNETAVVPTPAVTTNQTQYTSSTEFIKTEIVKTETIESQPPPPQSDEADVTVPTPIVFKNSTVVSSVSLESTNNIISSSNTIANNHIVFSIKSDGNVASSSVAAGSIAATTASTISTKKIDGPRIISSTTIKPALTLVSSQTQVKSLRPPALTSIVTTPNTTMPSLAALSNTLSTQQQLSQPMQIPQQIGATKIVQIKTAPTIQMVPSANVQRSSIQNIPPLIPTQQPTILNIAQNVSLANRQQPITIHTQTSAPSTISYITTSQAQLQQQQQQQGQPSTIQLSTGQQKYTPVMMSPAVKGKTIILANPSNVSQQKTIILRSVGPDGNAIYQQVPLSNVSGLQMSNLTSNNNMATILTTQTPGLIKTSTQQQQQPQYQQIQTTATHQNQQLPALVPTSYTPMVITSTQNNQPITNQQTQSGPTLRPLLVTNSQGLNILPQGLTLIQRPGQQAQLVQTIQQPQTIRLQQQPQIVQIQQQPQTQQVQLQPQRTIVTSQPQPATQRKGLTLSASLHIIFRCSPNSDFLQTNFPSSLPSDRMNMLPN